MSALVLSSSNIYLQQLRESNNQLKQIGLQKLIQVVDYHWAEIADHISHIESIYEDDSFSHKTLAAYLASKIYYHLEQYSEAVDYALEAWDQYINQNIKNDPYIDCMIQQCIDKYIAYRQKQFDNQNSQSMEDEKSGQNIQKLERVINSILDQQIQTKEFKQTLGVCIEARRMDKIKQILQLSRENAQVHSDTLIYLSDLAMYTISNYTFKVQVLEAIVEEYEQKHQQTADYANLSQVYFLLKQHKPVADLLQKLNSSDDEKDLLLSYQIAQDISENESRYFNNNLIAELPVLQQENQELTQRRNRLLAILNGNLTEELDLMFLITNNQSDQQVIKNLKTGIDAKNSVAHQGVILSHSIMQSGTTDDTFLRENFDWIATASHWSKFSLVSSLGVIHKGNHNQAMQLLQPYFPQNSANPIWYANGGALYGLGLIFNKTKHQQTINFILEQVKSPQNNQNEQIIHGSCLGLGLVGLGSEDKELLEEIKNILFTNQATTGEAAGLAIGLIMAGSADQDVIQDILQYAKETEHEKIIRAIALALAMIMFSKQDLADTLIEQLLLEKDPILRYGGVFMIGLAYVGTGNNRALRKLLHYASADVSDDVRRASVISIAFLMLNSPEQMPKITSLLIISYNPHVRYGAALALGIACAGSGSSEALAMLEPMMKDSVDFVRQGAYIGMAMVLQQVTEKMEPRVDSFKKTLNQTTSKKHEELLSRLGAILATGIIEAGGRNSVINLTSRSGSLKMGACVSMLVFTHYWYWFPCVNFLSLAQSPSALIGVNSKFQIPQSFNVLCNAKASLFNYPEKLKVDDKQSKGKTQTFELSITAKAKARQAKRDQQKDNKMEIEEQQQAKQPEKIEEEEQQKVEEAKPEPETTTLQNPCRILEKQQQYIQLLPENRYTPIINNRKQGIVFLQDSQPDQPDTYLQLSGQQGVLYQQVKQEPAQQQESNQQNQQQQEVQAPEPFIFDEEAQRQ